MGEFRLGRIAFYEADNEQAWPLQAFFPWGTTQQLKPLSCWVASKIVVVKRVTFLNKMH